MATRCSRLQPGAGRWSTRSMRSPSWARSPQTSWRERSLGACSKPRRFRAALPTGGIATVTHFCTDNRRFWPLRREPPPRIGHLTWVKQMGLGSAGDAHGASSGAGGTAMRLITAAFTLVIIVCVAAFGAILSQKTSDPVAAASAPAAPADPIRTVVTLMDESNAPPPAGPADATTAAAALVTAQAAPARAPIPAATAVPAAASAPPATSSCPGNPNALGVSRVVEIDTTGGPQFGFEHFKSHDFLRPGEVVLTFD